MSETKNTGKNNNQGDSGDVSLNNGRVFKRRIRTFEIPEVRRGAEKKLKIEWNGSNPWHIGMAQDPPEPEPPIRHTPLPSREEAHAGIQELRSEFRAEHERKYGPVQAKTLSVSQPDDPQEKEADRMADRVLRMEAMPEEEELQRAVMPEEEELQRDAMPEEEEELQRDAMPEEEELQREKKPEDEEIARRPAPRVSTTETALYRALAELSKTPEQSATPPSDPGYVARMPGMNGARRVQGKVIADSQRNLIRLPTGTDGIQRVLSRDARGIKITERHPPGRDGVALQKVYRMTVAEAARAGALGQTEEPGIQRAADGELQTSADTATRIEAKRGGGETLGAHEREFFESRMDADFSGVRFHRDAEAASLAKDVNAKAFTIGGDVFFGAGQYQPGSSAGKHLIAHELTHTVQQGAAERVGRTIRRRVQRVSRDLLQRRGARGTGTPAPRSTPGQAQQPKTTLGFLTQKALDGAIRAIDLVPNRLFLPAAVLGLIFKYGLRGMLQRLAQEGGDKVGGILVNIARAVTSLDFVKNYLTGFLKGFFVDGIWGTLTFIWDLIKLPYTLGKFAFNAVSQLGEVDIGAGLQNVANIATGAANWIGSNGRAILIDLKNRALSGNVASVATVLQNAYNSATGMVQLGGAKLADKMIGFFSQKSDKVGAELGNVAGTVAGNVSFEVASTVLTAGGAQGLLRLKGPVGYVARLLQATGKDALKLVGAARANIRSIYQTVRGDIAGIFDNISKPLGAKVRELIDGIMNFLDRLMARVLRGPKKADEAAAIGDVKQGAKVADEGRGPGGRERSPDAERPQAVAIAKGFTAANERAGTPAETLDGILTNSLKPRFSWLKGFDTPMIAPGHHKVIMRTVIDGDYSPDWAEGKRYTSGDIVKIIDADGNQSFEKITHSVIDPYTKEQILILDNKGIVYQGKHYQSGSRRNEFIRKEFQIRSQYYRKAISQKEFAKKHQALYMEYSDLNPNTLRPKPQI